MWAAACGWYRMSHYSWPRQHFHGVLCHPALLYGWHFINTAVTRLKCAQLASNDDGEMHACTLQHASLSTISQASHLLKLVGQWAALCVFWPTLYSQLHVDSSVVLCLLCWLHLVWWGLRLQMSRALPVERWKSLSVLDHAWIPSRGQYCWLSYMSDTLLLRVIWRAGLCIPHAIAVIVQEVFQIHSLATKSVWLACACSPEVY